MKSTNVNTYLLGALIAISGWTLKTVVELRSATELLTYRVQMLESGRTKLGE